MSVPRIYSLLLQGALRSRPMHLGPLFIRAYSPPIAALSSTNALHTATSPRRPRRPFVYACTNIGVGNSAASRDATKPPKREISTSTSKDLPEILEDDLEEQFVRGSGPGGQKINKTACCVVCVPQRWSENFLDVSAI